MCATCIERYRAQVGKPLPPAEVWRALWVGKAEVEADMALLGAGLELNEEGRPLVELGINSAIMALGDLMAEEGVTLTMGWLALLGAAEAARQGILPAGHYTSGGTHAESP